MAESPEDQKRRQKFRERISAMLERHKFINPDYEPMVQFAMENNLDKKRSTMIYKLYTRHQVDVQMKKFEAERLGINEKNKQLAALRANTILTEIH